MDKLTKLISSISTDNLGSQFMEYLQGRGKVPDIALGGVMNPEASGEFKAVIGGDDAGRVGLRPSASSAVLGHELAHAAERQLIHQKYELGASEQFKEAHNKLISSEAREKLINALGASKWAKAEGKYRANPEEIGAWAAQRYMGEGSFQPAPDHIDATMATELALVMALAKQKRK